MLIIGSHALNLAISTSTPALKYTLRKPADIDLIGTFEEIQALGKSGIFSQFYPVRGGDGFYGCTKVGGVHVEMEIAWEDTSGADILALDTGVQNRVTTEIGEWPSASPLVLYLLKMSHRYLKDSPHFHKTMADIHLLRVAFPKLQGYVNQFHSELLKKREKETYTYSHPSLNQSKEQFFTESGNLMYTYDHDSIHEVVSTLSQPAYKLFAKDGEEVAVDKFKWLDMSHYERLLTVLEEAYVLAIERSIVPYGTEPEKAFKMALQKITSSISSGWWREWAWEHYYEVEQLYDASYVEKFRKALSEGLVKPFKGGY